MGFEDITPEEDIEIEVGNEPEAAPAGPTAEEILAQKDAAEARAR